MSLPIITQHVSTYYNSKITLEFDQSTATFFLLRNTVSGGLTSPLDLIVCYLFYYFSLKKLGLDLCKHQIKKIHFFVGIHIEYVNY